MSDISEILIILVALGIQIGTYMKKRLILVPMILALLLLVIGFVILQKDIIGNCQDFCGFYVAFIGPIGIGITSIILWFIKK